MSAWQSHESAFLCKVLVECRTLTYNAISFAKQHGLKSRRQMKEFYRSMSSVDVPSCFKLAVITRACAVLRSRTKSEKRRISVAHPRPLKLASCIISGFFVTATGKLFIGLGPDRFEMLKLNAYVFSRVSLPGIKMRSLTITKDRVGICYSAEIQPIATKTVFGVDLNEKNIAFGDRQGATLVDMSAIPRIKQTTREIVASFKRRDVRVRRNLSLKYWGRATARTSQILHDATNLVVQQAVTAGAAIALEDIAGINKMYQQGNRKGKDYRFRMNSWPHFKAYKMIEYKSAWNGVTVIKLTKGETRGSSSVHLCGEKLHRPVKGDLRRRRQLWCEMCRVWNDRDQIAVANLAQRGLSRLASSLPSTRAKGPAGEVVNGNPTTTAIPKADADKLTTR